MSSNKKRRVSGIQVVSSDCGTVCDDMDVASVDLHQPSSALLSLSAELLEMIAALLPAADLCRLATCHSRLRDVAHSAGNEAKVAQAGGIEAIVAAMDTHRESIEVQCSACCALANIAYEDENKAKVALAGGIEAIVEAMNVHLDSASVQEHACWALFSVAFKDDQNRTTVALAGGIEAIVAAMTAHPDSAAVQRNACSALRDIALAREDRVTNVWSTLRQHRFRLVPKRICIYRTDSNCCGSRQRLFGIEEHGDCR
eukprot:TRINITY_DN809_c2_g1_i1.p1 TRINITY_DN809_c2_g1~~TRINITY_DN809_c2_g1_i1.p1  ORF type:complete len:257 (-),score=14.09 TRINITY_DN809_c2_g1_i1:235-1005(-)